MKIFTIFVLPLCVFITFETKPQDDFWSRVNVGILGGPLFPAGDETDAYNLSTGYYFGIDARISYSGLWQFVCQLAEMPGVVMFSMIFLKPVRRTRRLQI